MLAALTTHSLFLSPPLCRHRIPSHQVVAVLAPSGTTLEVYANSQIKISSEHQPIEVWKFLCCSHKIKSQEQAQVQGQRQQQQQPQQQQQVGSLGGTQAPLGLKQEPKEVSAHLEQQQHHQPQPYHQDAVPQHTPRQPPHQLQNSGAPASPGEEPTASDAPPASPSCLFPASSQAYGSAEQPGGQSPVRMVSPQVLGGLSPAVPPFYLHKLLDPPLSSGIGGTGLPFLGSGSQLPGLPPAPGLPLPAQGGAAGFAGREAGAAPRPKEDPGLGPAGAEGRGLGSPGTRLPWPSPFPRGLVDSPYRLLPRFESWLEDQHPLEGGGSCVSADVPLAALFQMHSDPSHT